jgi:hypothetical protein
MKVSVVSHVRDRFGGTWCLCRTNCHRSEGGGGLSSAVVWLDTKLLWLAGSRDSTVTIVTGLRAGVSGRGTMFLSSPKSSDLQWAP